MPEPATTLDEIRSRGKAPFSVDREAGRKLRTFYSKESADLAERFLARLQDEPQVGVPRLHARDGLTLEMDYLPGSPITDLPVRARIAAVSALQARLHELDWPGFNDPAACLENYRGYLAEFADTYAHLGLLPIDRKQELLRRFAEKEPQRFHPALIHDDLWSGNVLVHQEKLFLIDYASVKYLALESDLLNSSRAFSTRLEALVRGPYSLKTAYLKSYGDQGSKMKRVLKNLTDGWSFFVAYNSWRKGANMLWRVDSGLVEKRAGLKFAGQKLAAAWKML